MLGLSRDAFVSKREPFNVGPHGYALGGLINGWYPSPAELPEAGSDRILERIERGTSPVYRLRDRVWSTMGSARRPVIKDPIACLCAGWLRNDRGWDVLVVIRHPCGFVASLRRVGWDRTITPTFEDSPLLTSLLDSDDRAVLESGSAVERSAVLWRCLYQAITCITIDKPDIAVVRHEDLSSAPLDRFRALYDRFGLRWSSGVARRIQRATASTNPTSAQGESVHQLRRHSRALTHAWRQELALEEVQMVRRLAEPVASDFYGDHDW